MKRSHLLCTGATTVSLLCCSAVVAQGSSQHVVEIDGMVSKSRTSGEYSFSDFKRSRTVGTGGKSFRQSLRPPFPPVIETEQVVKLHVTGGPNHESYNYNALLGALGHPVHAAAGSVKPYTGPVVRHKNAPVLHLEQGWAFLWTNPSEAVAATKWVVGATEGSTMVVEIVDDTKERVYFLEGKQATVTCNKAGTSTTPIPFGSTDHGKYIDVTYDQNDCEFSAKKDIIGARKAFIDDVKKIATAADWP